MVVQIIITLLPSEIGAEEGWKIINEFFKSPYFYEVPYRQLSARIFSKLREMVRSGAYPNREEAIRRLRGFFQDVKHVATYAPYSDAFVMDQTMASMVSDSRINLESQYNLKVFSLNNWDDLLAWLKHIEAEMSDEHREGLSEAYP